MLLIPRLPRRRVVRPHLDRYTLERRQQRVAEKIARASGRSRDEVLVEAYRRADRVLAEPRR